MADKMSLKPTTTPSRPRVLALTGGIASGKSSVLKVFEDQGFPVLSADEIAREVVVPGSPGLVEIKKQFGSTVLNEDGTLNRKALGKLIFHDPVERKKLEAILHPRIRERSRLLIEKLRQAYPETPVIYEVPLYYESGLSYPEIDGVIVVYCPKRESFRRLMERDGMSVEEAQSRIDSQLDIEVKRAKADYVIENTHGQQKLRETVTNFINSLSTTAR